MTKKKDDLLTVTIIVTGAPETIVDALVNGFPRPLLENFRDAMVAESAKRKTKKRR